MGQEMPYRYQEHLMSELLDALRGFLARVDEPDGDAASGPTRVGVAAANVRGARSGRRARAGQCVLGDGDRVWRASV
jgi:hypothetical protein